MRVLTYHGVVDHSTPASHFSSLFTGIRSFEEQAALPLVRRGRPVSLAEIEASLTGGHRLPDGAVHVTFDDGFRNNLVAAEILDRHRIPWSLFVVVDSVLEGYRPWYVRLADAIGASSNVMLRDGSVFEMSTPARKRAFARLAKVEVMTAPDGDQDGAVDRVITLPGMCAQPESTWSMLEPAELVELRSGGVEIGNHSARHRNLLRCSDADLVSEVSDSRTRLEDALGAPVRYFAYPDGRHDRRVRKAVGEHHALGLATWTWHRPTSRLALRRYEAQHAADLERILEGPGPRYGARWARWNLPLRGREARVKVDPSARQVLV